MDVLDFPAWLALVAVPAAYEEFVRSQVVPVVAVAPSPAGGAPDANLRVLAASATCVVIGVGLECDSNRAGEMFDVIVADEDGLADLEVAIAASPIASVALALLLRGSDHRSAGDGLAAESAVYSTLLGGPEFARWRETHEPEPRVSTRPAVLVERSRDTLTITLSRPEVHNAYNAQMRDELTDALNVAIADPGLGRVVLRGAGPSFCSGGDLDEFGLFADPATAHIVRLTRSAPRLLALLADRVEVYLKGACFGAGIELSAFARRLVAAPDTEIALPEIGLGLIPGAGGTVSVPRRIGRHRTAWLALTGTRIDARTALAWGLVDAIAGEDSRSIPEPSGEGGHC